MSNVAALEEQIVTLKEMVEEYSDDLMEKAEELSFKNDEIANLKARLADAHAAIRVSQKERDAMIQATNDVLSNIGKYLKDAIEKRTEDILYK